MSEKESLETTYKIRNYIKRILFFFISTDCLHLQLYGDSKDRYKQGQTKASLSLQHFLGVESGFTLDKESNTIAIICQDVTVVLAFDTRERLIQWQVKISNNLGEGKPFVKYIMEIEIEIKKVRCITVMQNSGIECAV